jgi:hydrogenase nickel incorporation protein HypA/HybF
MHERSLVRALLRQVEKIADENASGRVVAIHVRIGEFSGVEPDLLAGAYDDLVQETRLQGAALELQKTPLQAVCDQCGDRFRIERFNFQCGKCGSLSLALSGGEEMLLESVTMEEVEL